MKSLAPVYKLPDKLNKNIVSWLPEKTPILRGSRRIPVAEPNLTKSERKFILSAFDSSWISSGSKFVTKFEELFGKIVSHTKFNTAVNSGTSALELIIEALDIGPGDEVILPAFTMIATLNAVVNSGATPVLVDADRVSWNMDVSEIENKITKKTKAILVVHIYGAPVQMNVVRDLAKKYQLWVIEDAAEAHGAEYHGKRAGSLGDAAAFSLYANKVITTGEGGMVCTNNPEIDKRIKLLANHAFSPERHFWHSMVAHSYKMSGLQAAVGFAQTKRFEEILNKKLKIAGLYRNGLSGVPGLTLPINPPESKNIYWMFGILISEGQFGMNRNGLCRKLAGLGIETRTFFVPMHWQPVYHETFRNQHFPVSEALCRDGLYLPSASTLKKNEVNRVIAKIIQAHQGKL